ncbi:hypothetical protein AAG570_009359 [Ranatra chinensis]|uniref:Uncharacterized protein n=1 Tax=Ranatra chinensis TaxID=642074 RepID=A0ABD0Z9Y4_9HEMI
MGSVPLLLPDELDLESGRGKGIEDDFAYRNNVHQASVKVRLGFLRKVYSLLFFQLLVTVVIGFVFMFYPRVRMYIHNNDWLLTVAFLSSVVILIALHIKRKESPTNFILLGLFTIVQAYTVGVLVTFFEQFVVLQALVLSIGVVGGLTLYTFQTKKDFSNIGVLLYCALCVLLIGGILQIFFGSTSFELGLSVLGAFTFSLFIIFDTQNLMRRVSPEEYIFVTINLYLDILNLFIYILRALQASRKH